MNPGLSTFWNGVMLINRLTFGRPLTPKDAADMRGWTGAINIEFEGAGGGAWHVLVLSDRSWVMAGAHPSPRATVRMDVRSFFIMVAGHSSIFSLILTGAVTTEGEGLSAILLYSIIARMRMAATIRGPIGWLFTFWLRRAVARSATGLELVLEESA